MFPSRTYVYMKNFSVCPDALEHVLVHLSLHSYTVIMTINSIVTFLAKYTDNITQPDRAERSI